VGRLFGLLGTVFVVGILVGNVVAGIAVDVIGLKATMVLGSVLLIACGLLALPRARRLDRRSAESAAAVADRVAVLRRLRIFDGASQATLESVAAAATDLHVTPGTVVVREGETGDAFYVVRAGSFTVSPVGRTLDVDDYFGEIGILEGVPRTATVTAATDADLYRIEADAFVAAVNEAPAGMLRLADTLAGRLARTHPSRRATFTGRGTAE